VIRGPYCTGAVTPCGAVPHVVIPQAQRRATSWCSVTRTVIGGRSNTCRRCIPTSGASARSAPQPVHGPGSCRSRSSGLSTSANVDPGCPGCPPGLRPLLRRSDFGAGLANGESDDGGFDEFREFCPNCRFSSAFSARSCSTITRSSDIIARSRAFSAASSS
jgi:hypothetical protein